MLKKILIGLGVVAAAGLVLVLAPLTQQAKTESDAPSSEEEKGREEESEPVC